MRVAAVIVVVFLCRSMLPDAVADTGLVSRVWTSIQGRSVTAVLMKDEGDAVQLRAAGGKKLSINRLDLSAKDIEYLDGLRGVSPAAPGLSPVEATRAQPDEPETALEQADPAPGSPWSINNVGVVTNSGGIDISNAYTQKFETAYCSRTAPQGHRLVLVKCSIEARSADREAIDKLNRIREPMAEKLELIGKALVVSDADKKDLTGEYRMINAEDVTLSTPSSNRCQAAWIILPEDRCGMYFFENGTNKPVFGGVPSRQPWHHACTSRNGFAGLIEVGKPAPVGFLFCVPRSLDLHTVKLEIEGQGGLPL